VFIELDTRHAVSGRRFEFCVPADGWCVLDACQLPRGTSQSGFKGSISRPANRSIVKQLG